MFRKDAGTSWSILEPDAEWQSGKERSRCTVAPNGLVFLEAHLHLYTEYIIIHHISIRTFKSFAISFRLRPQGSSSGQAECQARWGEGRCSHAHRQGKNFRARGDQRRSETIRDDSSKKFNDTVVMIVPKNEKWGPQCGTCDWKVVEWTFDWKVVEWTLSTIYRSIMFDTLTRTVDCQEMQRC